MAENGSEDGNGRGIGTLPDTGQTRFSILPQKSSRNLHYSPLDLKSYDRIRHLDKEEMYRLIREEGLPEEKLTTAIEGNQIRVYHFKGKNYLDRLDVGRVFHDAPKRKEGLHIERYFSDEETDPLDITYEKRALKITDTKGNAIFSMEDALFPPSWNDVDAQIVAQKYFFKPNKEEWKEKLRQKIGSEYENSPRHLVERVSHFFAEEGEKLGYFKTPEDKKAFADELKALQIQRRFAFNSPVQFNAGIFTEYGIEGSPGINYWRNPETGEVIKVGEGCNVKTQCHACFIKGPRDDLESILKQFTDEGGIFSSGSGIGYNVGAMRGKHEPLSGGGKSSGSMSFFGVHDRSAGSIKSGGKSRRAARMATMDQDHPDILEFIRCKVNEDHKALVLMQNGYSPGMDGEAYTTVDFQNTNLSVRLDDLFFDQLKKNDEIELRRVTDGIVMGKIPARRMMEEIAFATWRVGDPGVQYKGKIDEMHTSKNSGRIMATNPCSEYVFLDDTSCNLASLNLATFADEKGNFDGEAFKRACRLIFIAQDIANDAASYPVEDIATISPEFRTIGLGYANLGTLLMRKGLAYDSDEGRATAAAITALMTGVAYETSTELAENLGTFIHYEFNKKPFLEVMKKHQKNLEAVLWEHVPTDLKKEAHRTWEKVVKRGEAYGFRNAQATVLAPTGTISYLMGCETTGVEPAISLSIGKDLAGGGRITLVNKEITNALSNLGYTPEQLKDISAFVGEENTIVGAPHVNKQHYSIFATALGNQHGVGSVPFEGHIKMLAATQPFISGAISKTNNLPESATVKDIFNGYVLGYDLGLKALAVFRNESKPSSALNFHEKGFVTLKRGEKEELPTRRRAFESEVTVGGYPLHVIVSEYPNGRPGQITLLAYRAGSTLKALLETHGISASKSLKRGVDLETITDGWIGQEFEPKGLVQGHAAIKTALSPLDYAGKLLLFEYKGVIELADDKEGVKIEELRGVVNGAVRTYRKAKVDDWNFEHVMKDPELGGFVKGDQLDELITTQSKRSLNNARGIPCRACGNPMMQISPNCYTCGRCGDKIGGCGL